MDLFNGSWTASSTLNRACGGAASGLADIFGHVDIVFQNFLFDTGTKVFLSGMRLEHFIQAATTAAAALSQTAC